MKSKNEKVLNVLNPATGKILKKLRADTASSIERKFRLAEQAQKAWSLSPWTERVSVIAKFRDLVTENLERLAHVLTSEVGKPIVQSRNEIRSALKRIDFFLKSTEARLKPVVIDDQQKITFEPLGVVANISAWNYPYLVGVNVFVPALLTGNAVLYKPSEWASLTGVEIEKLFQKSGLPKNLFGLILGGGPIGQKLLQQPIHAIFFTGSNATGAKIAAQSAHRLMKVQLELGGKDPIYVCEDVDVESSATAVADGAFYNTGQGCCSVERIYVHKAIHTQFVEALKRTISGFVIGDPNMETTYIGPLTRAPQIKIIESQIRDALKKGAHLELGGHRVKGPGNYFEPTLLTKVNHKMRVMREESFGPLVCVQKVRDDQEAISLMNDTSYGLTCGIYTKDEKRAERVLSQLNSGTVYWNCCDRVTPELPWTGRKGSGIGVTLSYLGIDTFLQPKAWHRG